MSNAANPTKRAVLLKEDWEHETRAVRTGLSWTRGIGFALAAFGVVIGVVTGLQNHRIGCPPDSGLSSASTPSACYSFPHAGIGAGIAIICALLGIVVGLLVFLVSRLVVGTPPVDDALEPTSP